MDAIQFTHLVSSAEVLIGALWFSNEEMVIPAILLIANCSCSQANFECARAIFLCICSADDPNSVAASFKCWNQHWILFTLFKYQNSAALQHMWLAHKSAQQRLSGENSTSTKPYCSRRYIKCLLLIVTKRLVKIIPQLSIDVQQKSITGHLFYCLIFGWYANSAIPLKNSIKFYE